MRVRLPPWAPSHAFMMHLCARICEITKRLYDRELIGPTEGNVSARDASGTIYVTPKGGDKSSLRPQDIAALELDCDSSFQTANSSVPSSEIVLHLRLYRERPDCMAVVHAHPIFATGFATVGKTIPDDVLPETGYFLGRVALVPFAIPGTEAVGDAIAKFARDHKTFLLANHGAVTIGATLDDAYMRMETLERVARILFVADLCGGPKKLPTDAINWLRSVGLDGSL